MAVLKGKARDTLEDLNQLTRSLLPAAADTNSIHHKQPLISLQRTISTLNREARVVVSLLLQTWMRSSWRALARTRASSWTRGSRWTQPISSRSARGWVWRPAGSTSRIFRTCSSSSRKSRLILKLKEHYHLEFQINNLNNHLRPNLPKICSGGHPESKSLKFQVLLKLKARASKASANSSQARVPSWLIKKRPEKT